MIHLLGKWSLKYNHPSSWIARACDFSTVVPSQPKCLRARPPPAEEPVLKPSKGAATFNLQEYSIIILGEQIDILILHLPISVGQREEAKPEPSWTWCKGFLEVLISYFSVCTSSPLGNKHSFISIRFLQSTTCSGNSSTPAQLCSLISYSVVDSFVWLLLCLVISTSFAWLFSSFSLGSLSSTMTSTKDLHVPEGEEETISTANREVTKLKQQITFLIKDGSQFPALTEIQRLLAMSDPTGVFKDLARAQARAKIEEVTRVMAEMEATCSNLAATVVSLGEGLNEKSDLDAAVAEIRSTEEQYVKKTRAALCALAAAAGGGPPAIPPPPPPVVPRPESNKFMKISATAEPSTLPRDVTPSDFQLWLMKFNTFSNASWIPGPPTSGEKLRQLRVY